MLSSAPYILVIGTKQLLLLRKGLILKQVDRNDKRAITAFREYCLKLVPSAFIVAYHDDRIVLRQENLPPVSWLDRTKLIARRAHARFGNNLCGWRFVGRTDALLYGVPNGFDALDLTALRSRHVCYAVLLPMELTFPQEVHDTNGAVLYAIETVSSGWVHYVVQNGRTIFYRIAPNEDITRLSSDVLATRDYVSRLGINKSKIQFVVMAQNDSNKNNLMEALAGQARVHGVVLGQPECQMNQGLAVGRINYPLARPGLVARLFGWLSPLWAPWTCRVVVVLLAICLCAGYDVADALREIAHMEALNGSLQTSRQQTDPRVAKAQEHWRAFNAETQSPAGMLSALRNALPPEWIVTRFAWQNGGQKKGGADITLYGPQDMQPLLQSMHVQLSDYSISEATQEWLPDLHTQNASGDVDSVEHHLRMVAR